MFRNKSLGLCLAALLMPIVAAGQSVVDQEQPYLYAGSAPIPAIDRTSEQKLAQTITAGVDGELTHVELPVICDSGTLIVEIVSLAGDLPGTELLANATVEAAAVPPRPIPWSFERIALSEPVRMSRGDRFAIVLRNETGNCSIARPADGDTYLAGQAFFDARPNPPGWVPWRLQETYDDLPFRTVVEIVDRAGQCSVRGLRDPLPIPNHVPVCRCVQDEQLREQRCTLLHPSLVLFRRLPFPLKPGEPFTVRWTLLPLAPLKGIVAVDDGLPPGFDASRKAPLWFSVDHAAPGETITLEYATIIPAHQRAFQLKTEITLSDGPPTPSSGFLHTTIPIIRVK